MVPALLVQLDYSFENFEVNASFVLTLALAAVLATLPFLAAGVVIALAIKTWSGKHRPGCTRSTWRGPPLAPS